MLFEYPQSLNLFTAEYSLSMFGTKLSTAYADASAWVRACQLRARIDLHFALATFSNVFMTSTRIPHSMQDNGDDDFELIRSAS